MKIALSLFWVIRTVKIFLFYFYLWQLKEYQAKRFIDHFRTSKGKSLILNKLYLSKIILLDLFFILGNFALYILLLLYVSEAAFFLKRVSKGKAKKPVLTKKTAVLIVSAFLLEAVFLIFFFRIDLVGLAFALLIFDLLSPLVFSLLVMLFQPLAVLAKKITMRKAKRKISEKENLQVIGITGSYGKSSTKEVLADILSEKYKVLKTKNNQNSEIGISRLILDELDSHQVFVAEMGAYGKGGIRLLAGIAKPEIGILTGINEQHLSLFGSQEIIVKTKYELIESLPSDGLAIFNGDNKHCLNLYKKTNIKKKIFKSSEPENSSFDLWAENVEIGKETVSFKACNKEKKVDFSVKATGKQIIPNILAAALAAEEMGITLEEISVAAKKINRTRLKKGKKGAFILDSSYSANPSGVLADLDYLNIWEQKKIIVMPCLIELGRTSYEVHQRIGKRIGEVCDQAVITSKECFKTLKESSGLKEMVFIDDSQKIKDYLASSLSEGDIVLLEGRVPEGVKEYLL